MFLENVDGCASQPPTATVAGPEPKPILTKTTLGPLTRESQFICQSTWNLNRLR